MAPKGKGKKGGGGKGKGDAPGSDEVADKLRIQIVKSYQKKWFSNVCNIWFDEF